MEEPEKADPEPIPTNEDASPSQSNPCALCGCATPAVRCDRCNSQVFCLSCDDMYHRHPKRKLHLRKAVDSIWTSARSPRLRRRTELPGDPCKIPIPPPRSKKREHRTIGGRTFFKSGLELGSFGHSKVFSPASKDFFAGQKSPVSMVESNCDDGTPSPNIKNESGQIYENDNITNAAGNLDDRSPWNPRTNISSPIQVSIPSSSPDIVANGQSFGYPTKPHSQSAADLTAHAGHPVGHHPYHFHPPYPYMHPPVHPYSHSMAHLNCAQCISSSWSNLMSPHPSPYFHPMPWGSAQNTLSRPIVPGQPTPMKHSHGDLPTYPDPGFHYPYPGAPYYHSGPPVVDPNFIKDLHEQAEMQKQRKEAKASPRYEEMDMATNPSPMPDESSSPAAASTEPVASTDQDAQVIDETPPAPVKPTEPWSCLHCTFINPPGSHICQVCCKTSYGNKPSEATEEESENRPQSRDTESPLINRDAFMNSPVVSEIRDAQKDFDLPATTQPSSFEYKEPIIPSEVATIKLTTETQTCTTTKTTDVQTQNITRKSMASSTDSIFPKHEMSVQTEIEALTKHCSVATDPMISSQSMESLLSGVSAPPYHNRRVGWGRGATSFSTQSLYERGRSRSPMPRSSSFHTEAAVFGQDSSFASEEAMHSASQAWLYADPMYYKPHNRVLEQSHAKEDYFDGTWGSMDRLNHRVNYKKDKEKLDARPKFHRSLDDLKSEKRPEFIHTHELMMLQTVKEAERCGFTLEDLHVAYLHCGKENPVFWLEDNWPQLTKNVIGLAAKYGEENEENDVGAITATEAKEALRIHRGDIWDAVAECIENRQRKILELTVRGNFTQKQIAETLKNNEGNVELAYADLLRASTKRHKFILSPGLSTDSEDLNVYNPTEDSTIDHNLSVSPMKAAKHDASAESKTEKKKSDFLTKLTAIREAQSERRKAREEKEMIRDTITQDIPVSAESGDVLKEKAISMELTPSISREDSKEVEEILQGGMPESDEILSKLEEDVKEVSHPKETTEDSIPVDFDTNWSESQGEWIEEYSDEQWEEGDEHWVGLGKKFQKMQKEFEEEAMQMASLWEKEELEDDVFEEETKVQQEVEAVTDSDKKFDDWVKANLKVDSSEYEEEIEMQAKPKGEKLTISLKEREGLEGSQPSPLQHYPTAFDLSLKSQFESDWVDLPADEEIEKLAHDIVCEGSDVENKFDEAEMVMYEEEKHSEKMNDQGSDEDWEKVEIDEQLQEVNELDNFAFPEKEVEIDRCAEEEVLIAYDKDTELPSEIAPEITIEKDVTVLYKNLERAKAVDASDVGIVSTEPSVAADISVNDSKKIISCDQPKVPLRRRSKLSSTDMDEALKNQPATEISSDIPPPLPKKTQPKGDQQKVLDIYAVPDKTSKVSPHEDHISKEIEQDSYVPQKPPRLNLSPTMHEESVLKENETEKETKISLKVLAKEGSRESYESESNFFADSESETEIKQHRPKSIHKKLAKYENELEEFEAEEIAIQKLEKRILKEKKDLPNLPFDLEISQDKFEKEENGLFESNFDAELDDDIDPSLIEPLPLMKDIDYDPELPILLGGRGRQVTDIDDINAPKAFRGDTTRPLQLFKATKKEIPINTLSQPQSPTAESVADGTSFIQPIPGVSSVTTISELDMTENQANETIYYNESKISEQIFVDSQVPHKQLQPQEEVLRRVDIMKDVEPTVQSISTPLEKEEEMPLAEIEALSAVADYFFGRYNEITVTPAKKKTPARPKPPAPIASKSPSKIMSSSEIASVLHPENKSQMEQSAAAVLQEKTLQEDMQISSSTNISKEQNVVPSGVVKEATPVPEKPKQPVPTECLSFAEDYLFGCYNQVVPPRKTKNVPVVIAKIPKLGEISSLNRPQSPLKGQKLPTPISTPEPPELPMDKQEELVEEEALEEDENDASIRTDTSATYDDIFLDFPSEMLSNQSFDESSIYYESFQDAVEDTQGIINMKSKSVHFVEPEIPIVPPRRNKARDPQKAKVASSAEPNESYANEYLFRQYEPVSQAKKKLPLCSEDFRMNQGLEPTEIPCDTFLIPDDDEEEEICSETSVEIPSKPNELCKSSPEYDFEDSEQLLDKHDSSKIVIKETAEIFVKSEHSVSHSDASPHLVETSSEIGLSNLKQDDSTDIQSEKSESFEELSVPDNLEEVIESAEKNESLSDHLTSSVTESQMVSVQQIQSYDTISNETSNRLEVEQFVFIEQTQDIINDESYNLYDIQDSLVCDLNYVNIKGNIEDECTDDSEQEWKRNEDRKNTLNASFLANAPIKKLPDDQEESAFDEFQQCDQKETKLEESQNNINQMEIVFDETQKSHVNKTEYQTITMDESKITQSQNENKIEVDQNLTRVCELTEIVSDDFTFSEQSEDNQFITTEVHDAEREEAISEIKNEGPLESSQDINEEISTINDEFQVISECTTTESFEKLTEKIDESLAEIEKELSGSISYVLFECDEVIPEDLNVISSVSELGDAANINEKYELESVEKLEISETDDATETEETKLDSSEISKIGDALMKEETKLKTTEEENSEAGLSDDNAFLAEDRQMYTLEDFEPSGDLSDDNVSTHSSVSTQIAVSMKIALKESEGDECSLNLEQIDNFEEDSEISLIQTTTVVSQKIEDNEENISEIEVAEMEKSEISEVIFSEEIKHEYETENDSLNGEKTVPEIIETVDSESKSLELENNEIEALMAEECNMSRFYDEWYQNEESNKFSYLSTESIYAKYGKSESSESGNESDIDNASSALDSKDVTNEANAYEMESSLDNQLLEKDDSKISFKENMYEETKYDAIDTYQKYDTSDISYYKNEVDMPSNVSLDLKLESFEDNQQICGEEFMVNEKPEISLIQDEAASFTFKVGAGDIQCAKEQETSDSKTVINKYSTSKSCQTEDSFEEDVFFDSFDDTFTIPSYINLPIENETKPPTTDISIQCELISIDDILSSKKILTASQTETQIVLPVQDSPDELKLRGEERKVTELAPEEKEESSCESFEDSDSDIFIESPSSQDELDVGAKRGLLYAEVDSDTGFSSGSECGWTKKTDYKQKELKKISQVGTTSKIISLQTSSASSDEKGMIISIDSSIDDIQGKITEISCISQERMTTDNIERDVQIFSDNARSSPFPLEIIERAVTPVAVPQFPSFEDDLVFVEVKETIEEITDNTEEEAIEVIPAVPTVEYFYGPLPETVKIKSPPDSNEMFFETASEISESGSLSVDKTESFSDSTSSSHFGDKVFNELKEEDKIGSITKCLEDESFAETLSSLKGETEDSTSEYYSFPESNGSFLSRSSITESDIFDYAQSEFVTDEDFIVDPNYVLTNSEDKQGTSLDEKLGLPISEMSKSSDIATNVKSTDTHSEEISSIEFVRDVKETSLSCDVSQVIKCEKSLNDQSLPEKKDDFLTDSSVEIQTTVPEEALISSKTVLSTDECQIVENVECEYLPSSITKSPSDLPPVPSDIVRYLYYDDSIPFDDESYTQAGSVEVPSSISQDAEINSTDKITVDKEKTSVDETHTTSSVHVSKISEEKITVESESEPKLRDKLAEKSVKMDIQDIREAPAVFDISEQKTGLTVAELPDTIADLAEKAPESKLCLLKNVQSISETDLKFPSIEVLPSESIGILPAAAEESVETIVFKEEPVGESVAVSNIPFEDVSIPIQNHKSQNVDEPIGLKQVSTEIPPVPSDIVRYLYYGDDITFDEMSQSSFHSQYDNDIEDVQLPMETAKSSELKPVISDKPDTSPKLQSKLPELTDEKQHLTAKSDTQYKLCDVSLEESSCRPDSTSAKDESNVLLDSSEFFEDWFDLGETSGVMKNHDSEQYTRSSAVKEESEPPCIPEYILSPKLSADIPIGKTDVDEVTDISTHFTMTDDSDRFSDIENDISLNFEEEYILPVEDSDQIEMDQLKDNEFFESCIKNEKEEMFLNAPEVADEFQFLTTEPLKELPEQKKITESVPSNELEEDLPQEKVKKCMIPNVLNDQPIHHDKTGLEFPEQKEMNEFSSDMFEEQHADSFLLNKLPEQLNSKEIDKHASYEFIEKLENVTEKIDECITSHSEVSKEEFAECVTSSELVDQKPDVQKEVGEIFVECTSSAQISEMTKEHFVECQTSNELLKGELVQHADKDIPEDQLSEQTSEYIRSDENGNFPEPVIKYPVPDSIEEKDHIFHEISEICPTTKDLDSSPVDKNEDINTAEHSVLSEPSHIIPEVEISKFSHKELEINLQQSEVVETISSGKDNLETSSCVLPVEESHSVSTEVSDNWSDAEGRYTEEDVSVYDMPLDEINNFQSDICITAEKSNEELPTLETDFANLESFSSDSKITGFTEMDALTSESSKQKFDIKITETVNIFDFKPDISKIAEDLSVSLIENIASKHSEVSHNDSYESHKSLEADKMVVRDEMGKPVDIIKSDIFPSSSSFEQNSKQPQLSSDSLLSSDMKLIHKVKLETEPEISSTMKEKIQVECMSTTLDVEPTFSADETMHDSKDIQSGEISSQKECLREEVITGVSIQTYAGESSFEDKINSRTESEGQIVGDFGILENSAMFNLKTGDDSISKDIIKNDIVLVAQNTSETVDFKIIESTTFINEEIDSKFTQGEKCIFSSDIISSDSVDFKGELIIDDFIIKAETAGKSCDEQSVTIEKVESKNGISCELLEIVDFKLISSQEIKNEMENVDFKCSELVDKKLGIPKDLDLELNEKSAFEIVDFKGQVVNLPKSKEDNIIISDPETKSTIIEKIPIISKVEVLKPIELEKAVVTDESLNIEKQVSFHKAIEGFEAHEVVDFKGQLTTHHDILEPVVDDGAACTEKIKFTDKFKTGELEKVSMPIISKDLEQIEFDTFETVNFKGDRSAYELKMQSEEDKIKKDIKTIKDSLQEKVENNSFEEKVIKEVVDFKGSIDSSCTKSEMLQKKSEVITENIDTSSKVYSDNNIYDMRTETIQMYDPIEEVVTFDSQNTSYYFPNEQDGITYDQQEMYSHNVDEQAVMFDPRETYGYGYGIDDQAITYDQQQTFQDEQSYYDEVMASKPVSHIISSEETSELYSCAETLSAASDTSLPFHSLTPDLEDMLNVSTSEDFTDVPSHFTSTEDSDKWSDVEGDFSLEEVEHDREKTPIRTPYEITTAIKKEFNSDIKDAQLNEKLTESVEIRHENILDSEKQITYVPELVTKNLTSKLEKEDSDIVEIVTELQNIKETKQENYMLENIVKTEVISSLTESDTELKLHLDRETLFTDSSVRLETVEDTELFSTKTDLSVISEAFTDVTAYISAEDSEKMSDVENRVKTQEKESKICVTEKSDILIAKAEIIDQLVSDNSLKTTSDIQIAQDDSLTEHFADIQSLKDSLTTVIAFSSFDVETAVPKMHEDISSNIPLHSEKTEPELWLEAETEHSISEISEDIAICIEEDGDTKFIFVDYEKAVESVDSINELSGTPYASTTSTSSSYSDLESSDHSSDTYADMSLQGATTESSDKWSDFEAEGLIDDVLYGNIDIQETAELTNFSQAIKKPAESKSSTETTSFGDHLTTIQGFETAVDISSSIEVKNKSGEVKIITEEKSDFSEPSASVKSTDFSSDNDQQTFPTAETSVTSSLSAFGMTVGLPDDEFTDVSPLEVTAESDKLSDISDDTSLGEFEDESSVSLKANLKMQDQELVATSIEFKADLDSNLKETESVDLKLSEEDNFIKKTGEAISIQPNVQLQSGGDTLSYEKDKKERNVPVDVCEELDKRLITSVEESSSIDKTEGQSPLLHTAIESTKVKDEVSSFSTSSFKIETSAKRVETVASWTASKEDFQVLKTDFKLDDQKLDVIPSEPKSVLSEKELNHLDKEKDDSRPKLGLEVETESAFTKETTKFDVIDQRELKETTESYEKDKLDLEDSSSGKITDESENIDSFTDIPTHTTETSDAYLDLDSDHSFEEMESIQVEAELQEEVQTPVIPSLDIEDDRMGYYENTLSPKDVLEDADDFALDAIPENELENFEEEEYSLSDHFEINEDELIFPLPYNDDWIEQSFELKEYGIEAEFYESETDIHGLGVVNEEYDDEDIQRAIDYNLSTLEENEEDVENITTESFKTLSHDASPLLKPDEYDAWSTADAPSIEEEFAEQDNVLSKIDDILAEDFSDLGIYQVDSYMKHDEGKEDYLLSNKYEDDLNQTDSISLLKSDSGITHEVTKLETASDKVTQKQILKTELDTCPKEIALKKDYTREFENKCETASDKIKVDAESSPKSQSGTTCAEITVEGHLSHILKATSDFVKKDTTGESSDTVIDENVLQAPTSCEITVEKDYAESFKAESKELSDKEYSKPDSEAVYIENNLKKDLGKSSKAESNLRTLDKDSSGESITESVSLSCKVAVKTEHPETETLKTSKAVSSEINIKRESKPELKPDSKIVSNVTTLKGSSDKSCKVESDVSNEVLTLNKKESKTKFDSISAEVALKEDYTEKLAIRSEVVSDEISINKSKPEAKQVSEVASDEISLKKGSEKDSKAKSEIALNQITLDKDSIKESRIESDSISSAIAVKKDCAITLKTDSETTSSEISNKRDYKSELKQDAETVFDETVKKSSKKDSETESRDVSNEVTFRNKSIKETKIVSDSASVEITIKKDSEKSFKSKQDSTEENVLKSVDEISEEKQISSIKEASNSQIKALEIPRESKDITDQFSDNTTSSVSKTDLSADIPLTKSEETQNKLSVSSKTSKESKVTELHQSSQLTESLKHSIKSTSESTEVQLNIPEQKVHKDEMYNSSSVTGAIPKEQISSHSLVVEVKPDIPKKTKQKSIDLTEKTPIKEEPDEKPSLPPKKSKRHSLTDSTSSSFSESVSSSSSAESFESAVLDKSAKSGLKPSDETDQSPEIPTRRSRSSKTSSSRSTSRDSEDSSSCSRSSSLKIRRRSSNFIEPEPIDLTKKRASIDERMKKLQNEGKCTTKEKAFIAAKLIEMQFEEEDALLASRQCNTVYHAVKFLTQLCDMCNCRFPINLMSSLVNCTHRACKECLRAHFTSLLYDRSVFTLLCPICHKPDITDQNIQEYFTHLDMTLRNILEDKVYDLFQRKLRDEVLTKDPNFHWCSQCSSGFIASPRLKKLYCPDCSAITCAMCHQTWELEHEGVHCERFQQWKDMHTPEPPPAGLVKYLTDRGISCPSCELLYAQACGGCLMYKCSHCSFEFCGFCTQPLKKGRECSNEICDSRGHHIHHLHNCLFFLRDKDVTEIQMLLEEESVTYLTIPPKDQIVKSRCQVREQKNNHGLIIEDRCGRSIEPYCAGLCRTHYYEYLSELLRKCKISPLSIMTIQDLQFMLRKSRIFVPEKVKGETSEDYYERLLDVVTKSLS